MNIFLKQAGRDFSGIYEYIAFEKEPWHSIGLCQISVDNFIVTPCYARQHIRIKREVSVIIFILPANNKIKTVVGKWT